MPVTATSVWLKNISKVIHNFKFLKKSDDKEKVWYGSTPYKGSTIPHLIICGAVLW